MNWVDGILIALLLAMVIVGSKKGLIRELMAFVVFFAAIIFSVNYIDHFAVWIYEKLGGSPLISAFLSFIILLALSYAAFKLVGILFYKVASFKKSGRRDQMGGALIGFLRGWLAVSFLTFLVFLLPLPDAFYTSFEASYFGPTIARTIPLVYDNTSAVHPKKPEFMQQEESTLMIEPTSGANVSQDREEVHRAIYNIDRFFNPAY